MFPLYLSVLLEALNEQGQLAADMLSHVFNFKTYCKA